MMRFTLWQATGQASRSRLTLWRRIEPAQRVDLVNLTPPTLWRLTTLSRLRALTMNQRTRSRHPRSPCMTWEMPSRGPARRSQPRSQSFLSPSTPWRLCPVHRCTMSENQAIPSWTMNPSTLWLVLKRTRLTMSFGPLSRKNPSTTWLPTPRTTTARIRPLRTTCWRRPRRERRLFHAHLHRSPRTHSRLMQNPITHSLMELLNRTTLSLPPRRPMTRSLVRMLMSQITRSRLILRRSRQPCSRNDDLRAPLAPSVAFQPLTIWTRKTLVRLLPATSTMMLLATCTSAMTKKSFRLVLKRCPGTIFLFRSFP
eukprot:m.918724 g.918724  ORF g.918724 m.918724 type:complete len:312 (+) comp60181_c0_seq1:18935-19870(+)